MRSPVVAAGDGSEPLLSCSVPLESRKDHWEFVIVIMYFLVMKRSTSSHNLKLDNLSVELHSADFLR